MNRGPEELNCVQTQQPDLANMNPIAAESQYSERIPLHLEEFKLESEDARISRPKAQQPMQLSKTRGQKESNSESTENKPSSANLKESKQFYYPKATTSKWLDSLKNAKNSVVKAESNLSNTKNDRNASSNNFITTTKLSIKDGGNSSESIETTFKQQQTNRPNKATLDPELLKIALEKGRKSNIGRRI